MSVKEMLERYDLTMEDVDNVIGDGEDPVTEYEISGFNENFFQEIRDCIDALNGKIPMKEHRAILNNAGDVIGEMEYEAYIHESYEDVVKRQRETGDQLITENYHNLLDFPIN